ncbi:uncharacterized protein METZ01_LOCUS286380, partial [marine metagenome]
QNFSIIEFYEMTKTFQISRFRKACPRPKVAGELGN